MWIEVSARAWNMASPQHNSLDCPSSTDPLKQQVGGSHYKDMAIQPVDYIEKNGLSYLEGAVVKYVSRHRKKGGRQDLDKAIHCIELLRDLTYGKT
jgi:hypothetical protein